MDEELEFKTRDMALAACLICESVEYLRVERDEENSRRLIFVFRAKSGHLDKREAIALVQAQRANSSHVVSSTTYDDALRRIKTVIHNS